MGSRVYGDLDDLIRKFHKLTFFDLKYLRIPENQDPNLAFELNKEHTSGGWKTNQKALHATTVWGRPPLYSL